MHWPNGFCWMSSFALVCNLFHKLTEIMVELFKTQHANTHFLQIFALILIHQCILVGD